MGRLPPRSLTMLPMRPRRRRSHRRCRNRPIAPGLTPALLLLPPMLHFFTSTANVFAQQPRLNQTAVLTSFYDSLEGPGWTRSDGWKIGGPCGVCEGCATKEKNRPWYGVSCDNNGNVEGIALPDNGLRGVLTDDLRYLAASLKRLVLPNNSIRGRGDNWMKWLGRLWNLEVLDLARNDIGGSLPPSLGALQGLRVLNVSSNFIKGSIPTSINGLIRLEALILNDNGLSGEVPYMLLEDSLMKEETFLLNLSSNALTGTLSGKGIFDFEDMVIDISDNQIGALDFNLCTKSTWNNGNVGRYGCDAIACPPGTWHPLGMHTNESGPCQRCVKANDPNGSYYYGRRKPCFNDGLHINTGMNILFMKSEIGENEGFIAAVSEITGGTIEYYDASIYTIPDVDFLLEYDCVMIHTNGMFQEPEHLSKMLSEYYELGGTVVTSDGFHLNVGGLFVEDGYSPVSSVGGLSEHTWCDVQYNGTGKTVLYSGISPDSSFCATGNNRDVDITIAQHALVDGYYDDGTPAAVHDREFRSVYLNGAYCWGTCFPSEICPAGDHPRRWANACIANKVLFQSGPVPVPAPHPVPYNPPNDSHSAPYSGPAPSPWVPAPAPYSPQPAYPVLDSFVIGSLMANDAQEGIDPDFQHIFIAYSNDLVQVELNFHRTPYLSSLDDTSVFFVDDNERIRVDFSRDSFVVKQDLNLDNIYESDVHFGRPMWDTSSKVFLTFPEYHIRYIANKRVYARSTVSGDRIPSGGDGYFGGSMYPNCGIDCPNNKVCHTEAEPYAVRCACPGESGGTYCENYPPEESDTKDDHAHDEHHDNGHGQSDNNNTTMDSGCPDGTQCLNGGQCLESPYEVGTYLCACNVGTNMNVLPYAGRLCEYQASSLCTPGPPYTSFCTNAGACLRLVSPGETHPGCRCEEGFEGAYCQFQKERRSGVSLAESVSRNTPPDRMEGWKIAVIVLVSVAFVAAALFGGYKLAGGRNNVSGGSDVPLQGPSAGDETLEEGAGGGGSEETEMVGADVGSKVAVEDVDTMGKSDVSEEEKEEIQPFQDSVDYGLQASLSEEDLGKVLKLHSGNGKSKEGVVLQPLSVAGETLKEDGADQVDGLGKRADIGSNISMDDGTVSCRGEPDVNAEKQSLLKGEKKEVQPHEDSMEYDLSVSPAGEETEVILKPETGNEAGLHDKTLGVGCKMIGVGGPGKDTDENQDVSEAQGKIKRKGK